MLLRQLSFELEALSHPYFLAHPNVPEEKVGNKWKGIIGLKKVYLSVGLTQDVVLVVWSMKKVLPLASYS